MSYFVNCRLCNKEADYTSVNSECKKCEGTGRDWREDHELSGFHSWAEIDIDFLKSKGVAAVDHFGKCVFTYRDRILSIEEDLAELQIRRSASPKQNASVFCEHSWKFSPDIGLEVCEKCMREKSSEDVLAHATPKTETPVFSYDRSLHDNRYYFPNRCHACKEYVNTEGTPEKGTDIILCNIGGEVEAQNGCVSFEPDNTASCMMLGDTCWNHSYTDTARSKNHCAIHGALLKRATGGCPNHVCKERNDVPIPAASDCVEVSRSHKHVLEYPAGGTRIRINILDAMGEHDIGMCSSVDECCRTCKFETHKMQDLGYCSFHDISLLCYFGSNPYGYDDKACAHYIRKSTLPPIKHSKILTTASTLGDFALSDDLILVGTEGTRKMGGGTVPENQFSIVNKESREVISKLEPYMLQSVQYHPEDGLVHCTYTNRTIKVNPTLKKVIEPEKSEEPAEATWLNSVSEDEWDKACKAVQLAQREHGLFSGSRNENCEECRYVERNLSYPDGSPTGLVCGHKKVFITANARCENYSD